MHSTNPDVAVSMLGSAVEEIQGVIRGTRVQGATVTPDGVYKGETLRQWLTALRADIERFLA